MCEFYTPPGAWPRAAGPEARKTPDNPCGMSGWIRGPPAPSSRGLRPPHPLQRSDPAALSFGSSRSALGRPPCYTPASLNLVSWMKRSRSPKNFMSR